MAKAICRICDEGKPEAEVVSMLVSKSDEARALALGATMLEHMHKYHLKFLEEQIVEKGKLFHGFMVMNQFDLDEPKMIEDVENMRDILSDVVMEYSEELEEEEENNEEGDEEPDNNIIIEGEPSRDAEEEGKQAEETEDTKVKTIEVKGEEVT